LGELTPPLTSFRSEAPPRLTYSEPPATSAIVRQSPETAISEAAAGDLTRLVLPLGSLRVKPSARLLLSPATRLEACETNPRHLGFFAVSPLVQPPRAGE